MISAHGAQLSVSATTVHIERSALAVALLNPAGSSQSTVEVSLSDITGVSSLAPTSFDTGWVLLEGPSLTIPFAPTQVLQTEQFIAAVEAALRGEEPGSAGASVPGLDFIGFDVETANSDVGSICQIGVVRIINGVEVASESWLCSPPPGIDHFQPGNIAIHGIKAEDVAEQPAFGERLPQFLEFVGELPVLAHNAQFDLIALQRACLASDLGIPELDYGCSLTLARQAKLGIASHRLPVVAQALDVPLDNHHDATEDARAAALIVVALARRAGKHGSLKDVHQSCGFNLGRLADGTAMPVLRQHAQVPKQKPAPQPKPKPAEEKGAAKSKGAPWQSVATPDAIPDANPDADPANPLFGQMVTLSGDFEPFDKGQLWSGMAELGAQIGKNVTRKTTILVAGTWATKTSKQKRAEELIEKGQGIEIWTSEQLFAVLGLDPSDSIADLEPPF